MKYSLIILFAFTCLSSTAQLPVYFTDMVKGNVTIQRKQKGIVVLKYHDHIMQEDIIWIGEGAEVTLVNKDNAYITLRKKGKYSVASIMKMPQSEERGILKLYFTHVWEKIKNTSDNSTETERITRSLGGVERGADCDLQLFPFSYWITATDSIHFEWSVAEKGRPYEFSLLDTDRKVLIRFNTCDTQLIIRRSLLASPENPSLEFYWRIKDLSGSCVNNAEHKIVWLSKDEYKLRAGKLIHSIPKEHTPHYYLKVAEKLKYNNYYELAAEYIMMAVNYK